MRPRDQRCDPQEQGEPPVAGLVDFMAEARARLAGRVDDPRFAFVVCRLWMDMPAAFTVDWWSSLDATYTGFLSSFTWSSGPRAPWITDDLVYRTLSVWQQRTMEPLTVAQAVEMLERVGRLGDVGVRP